MQNDRFWTRIFSQNNLTQHYNYLEKLSVILSFPPKLQTIRIQTFFQTNPYNTLRIGLHDKLPNLTLFFTPTWFSDIFYNIWISMLFSYKLWNFFYPFITLLIKRYQTISIKYHLQQKNTLLSSIATWFL